MKAYRSAVLRFDAQQQPVYDADGLLVVSDDGRIADVGDWQALRMAWSHVPTEHLPGRILAPGFVDMHIHYPQTDVIGSPAEGLLPWLENYTFPHESRFSDPQHAAQAADFFIEELLRNGVTSALVFSTSHASSVDALFTLAQGRGMRLITGKCLQDRHCPPGVKDQTEQGLRESEALIQRWHGVGRLAYAITPRFAPTSTDAQLAGAGELAQQYPEVWIQTHVSENLAEIRWVAELFPNSRSYLSVYDDFGLMRERAVYAHCIHFDDDDRALMRERQSAAAICPTSNLFLGSGFFDYAALARQPFLHGLASDVAAAPVSARFTPCWAPTTWAGRA